MARNVSPWPMISIEEATETALSLVKPLLPSTFPLGSLLVRLPPCPLIEQQHDLTDRHEIAITVVIKESILLRCIAHPLLWCGHVGASRTLPERLCQPLSTVFTPACVQGRVLCEDVFSCETIPAVPTSIVDGYAVVSSDGPGEFEIVGGSRAGGANTEVQTTLQKSIISCPSPLRPRLWHLYLSLPT